MISQLRSITLHEKIWRKINVSKTYIYLAASWHFPVNEWPSPRNKKPEFLDE